MKSFVHIYRIP